MRLDKRRLILVLLVVFVTVFTVMIAQQQKSKATNVVEDFKVEDVPNDDGTGLMLSWKPLDKDQRVIEYRIYRGISPDTLFFHASVQVNVKSGVTSERMYYYDSSYTDFIDIESPGKLRKEKQQSADSPLYRKIPRDVRIAAELSKKLQIITMVDKADMYYRSRKIFSADQADSTAYAGLKMFQQTMLATMLPGNKYYYSVVAINERNRFYDRTEVKEGVPTDNPPEPATNLYCALIEDQQKLNFEWDYPIYKEDLDSYQIYRMPASMTDEQWAVAKNDPTIMQSQPVARGKLGGGSLKNYTQVNLAEIGLTPADVKNSRFAILFADGMNQTAMSDLKPVRVLTSGQLPPVPSFVVQDKPNDKGDRLTVLWDDPVVFVTKTSTLNNRGTRLRVNYQLNLAETQKVKNIYFDFYKPGENKAFTRINEFYTNNIVDISIPAGYNYKNGLHVKMTMNGKPALNEDYVLEQDLVWNDQMMTLMPSRALYRNGVEVSRLQNVVYRQSMRGNDFSLVKRNTSYDNNLDVVNSYPASITKLVNGFRYVEGDSLVTIMNGERVARKLEKGDDRGDYTLVSSSIDLVFDKDAKTTLSTSIFADEAANEAKKTIGRLEERLSAMMAQKAELAAMPPAALAQFEEQIANLQKNITANKENKDLLKANSIKGHRARMRFIASVREPDSRYQTYMMVRTDGKGAITESVPDKNDKGDYNYYIPISNWFDKNKWTTLFASLIFGFSVFIFVFLAKRGKSLYIRPIAGLHEIDNAIGRATEMGRPMLYSMGNGGLSDVATLASLGILGLVAKKAAEYDTKLIVPCYNYIIMPIAQEIVREAHFAVGRPDSYDKNNIFFLTDMQFAYVAGFNGIMVRERAATNFFMGFFAAESLLMTETGNSIGAIQVAGTDAVTQIPFFITSCDYTLIGEELYAASAYLNREPMLLGTLKAQDYFKFIILSVIFVGAILASFQLTFLLNLLPLK